MIKNAKGLYGFRKDDVDFCLYSNDNGQPEYLGKAVLKFCADHTIEEMNCAIRSK